MKSLNLVIGALGLLAAQNIFASTCSIDREQMYSQIFTYDSINTLGCPFNSLGAGINAVSKPKQSSKTTCSAKCTYAIGPGSDGKNCSWAMGNWGNTLTCS